METASYRDRKNYVKYDNSHYLLYLREENTEITDEENGEKCDGFLYSGDMADGSTKIEASNVTDDNRRAKFISGLIGKTFDMDAQMAILANGSDTDEHAAELEEFARYRKACKAAVDELLSREV